MCRRRKKLDLHGVKDIIYAESHRKKILTMRKKQLEGKASYKLSSRGRWWDKSKPYYEGD